MGNESEKLSEEDHYVLGRVDAMLNLRQGIFEKLYTFANDGIKGLILLNGGTIPVLPTLKILSPQTDIENISPAIACFLLGLFAALFAQLAIYLSVQLTAREYDSELNDFIDRYREKRRARTQTVRTKSEISSAQEHTKYSDRITKWEKIALYSAITSMSLFIIGGVIAMIAFYPSGTDIACLIHM